MKVCTYVVTTKDPSNESEFAFGQQCVPEDFLKLAQEVKDPALKERLIQAVKRYFGPVDVSRVVVFPDTPLDSSSGFSTSGLLLTGASNSSTGESDFQNLFGVPFIAARLGGYITGDASTSFVSAGTAIDLVNSGISFVQAVQSGALDRLGQQLKAGWKALIFERPRDLLSDAQITQMRQQNLALLDFLRAEVMRRTERLNQAAFQFQLLAEFKYEDIQKNVATAITQLESAIQSLIENRNTIDQAASQITTISKIDIEKLGLPDVELQKLRDGLLPEQALKDLTDQVRREISPSSNQPSVKTLNAIVGLANSDNNPLRQEQYQNLLKQFLDDRGFIAAWAVENAVPNTISFTSSPKWVEIQKKDFNEALAVGAAETNSEKKSQAQLAMYMLADSDTLFSQGEETIGKRFVNRARVLLDYVTENDRLADYARYQLNDKAKETFNIEADTKTFEGYQLVDLANRLVAGSNLSNPINLFHAVTALQQAKLDSKARNTDGFLRSTDNSWAILDYLKGFSEGLEQFVYDFSTNLYQLVAHPIDSAESIYYAIVNYDKTIEVIAAEIEKVIDEYPNYSIEEKARLHARIAAEVGSMFVGAGAIKRLASVPKIASALETAASTASPWVYRGITGARRVTSIVPEFFNGIDETSRAYLALGNILAESKETFIRQLDEYRKVERLSLGTQVAISEFEEGASYFIRKDYYDDFVVRPNAKVLGRPDAFNQGETFLFAMPRKSADKIIEAANGSSNAFEKFLGFKPGDLTNKELLRIDLPFKFEYRPRLPSGFKAEGANDLFVYGGFTKGGVPELLFRSVPRADIVTDPPVSVLKPSIESSRNWNRLLLSLPLRVNNFHQSYRLMVRRWLNRTFETSTDGIPLIYDL